MCVLKKEKMKWADAGNCHWSSSWDVLCFLQKKNIKKKEEKKREEEQK